MAQTDGRPERRTDGQYPQCGLLGQSHNNSYYSYKQLGGQVMSNIFYKFTFVEPEVLLATTTLSWSLF